MLHPKEWEKVLDTNQKKPQSTPELDYHSGQIGAGAQAYPRGHPRAHNQAQGLHEI